MEKQGIQRGLDLTGIHARPRGVMALTHSGWTGIEFDPRMGEYVYVKTPVAKTITERVQKLRAEAAALGLKRREVYAHVDDWQKIKAMAEKLQRKREKLNP